MRYFVGLVPVLALGITPAVGCGDDANALASELLGTWVFVNAEENGVSWGEDCATDCDVLTFQPDGRFILMQPLLDRRFDGTWRTQGIS